MATFADLLPAQLTSSTSPGTVPFVPTIPPAQPTSGPDIPVLTSGASGTTGTSGMPTPPLPSWMPSANSYAAGITETLKALKDAGIYQDPASIARQVRGEFGDYAVQPPAPSAYQTGVSPWALAGYLLSGQYGGAYAQGLQESDARRLAAQKDYDQALRSYQQGKATWQSDLARATSEAQAANRGIVSSFLPYTAYRGGDVLGANERAYAAGLNYFAREAALGYQYLREANLEQYRGDQIQIRQDSNNIRQRYLEVNNALRSQNQQLAQEKWNLLQQEIRVRMQHEQTLTAKIETAAASADVNKAQNALAAIDRELTTAYHDYEQDAANANDPNDPTIQAEAAHIDQLEQQQTAWKKRVDQLAQQPVPAAAPSTVGGTQPPQFSSQGFPAGKGWQDPQTGHIWAPDGKGGWTLVR